MILRLRSLTEAIAMTRIFRTWATQLWAPVGRIPRLLVAAACLLVLGMYCTNSNVDKDPAAARGDGQYRPILARGDGHLMYLMARSTALDGDWIFDNDLARFGDPFVQPKTKTGRRSIVHPIGPALVWTPLIWVAEGGAAIANVFGAGIALHGYTMWHQRFVFLSSVLFACGAVLLGRKLSNYLGLGRWSVGYASTAVLLGTSLTYYATYQPSYSHAMDAFAAGAFITYWALTIGRRDARRFVVLGVLLGTAMLIRAQAAGLGVVLLLEWSTALYGAIVRRALRELPRWLIGGGAVIVIALIIFSPQLLEWQRVYGDWHALPQGAKFTRWGSPMVMEVLFSSRNGWLSTTPLCTAALLGLVLLLRKPNARLIAVGLLAIVVVQVYFGSVIFDWWGGSALGQRRLCNVTVPMVVGLASLLTALGSAGSRWRRIPRIVWHVVAVLIMACFVEWNLIRVFSARGGRGMNSAVSPCCATVPPPLRSVFESVYGAIGDPFSFPANALFAHRHGVNIQRWDEIVGEYSLVPPLDSLVDGTMARTQDRWIIGNGNMTPYVIEGLGAAQSPPVGAAKSQAASTRRYRWTTAKRARFLLPNLMPYGQRLTVWLAPGGTRQVRVFFDDVLMASPELADGWNAISFSVEASKMSVGEHEIALESDPRTTAVTGLATASNGVTSMPEGVAVGVAIAGVDLEFLPGVDAE